MGYVINPNPTSLILLISNKLTCVPWLPFEFVDVPWPFVVVAIPDGLTIRSGIKGKMDSVANESRQGSSSRTTLVLGKHVVVFFGLKKKSVQFRKNYCQSLRIKDLDRLNFVKICFDGLVLIPPYLPQKN